MFSDPVEIKKAVEYEKEKNKKLEKVVDMMAEDLYKHSEIKRFISLDEIKKYYLKKARKE